jgi:hypothetical protein
VTRTAHDRRTLCAIPDLPNLPTADSLTSGVGPHQGATMARLEAAGRASYPAAMIRNVVMVKLLPGQDAATVSDLMARFAALDRPGTVEYTIGSDLGLRDGTWSFAIVADFVDEAAYRSYDADGEHNRLRAELAPMAEQVARVQFEVAAAR